MEQIKIKRKYMTTSITPVFGTATLKKLEALAPKIISQWLMILEKDQAHSDISRIGVVDILNTEVKLKTDLFSLLLNHLKTNSKFSSKEIGSILSKVRLHNYQITDLFREIRALQNALENVFNENPPFSSTDNYPLLSICRNWLLDVFNFILEETSEIYEYVTELGTNGFCQLDNSGRILYANDQLKKIFGDDNLQNKPIQGFFRDQDSQFLKDACKSEKKDGRELRLPITDKKYKTLLAHICPLMANNHRKGLYGTFTDITSIEERNVKIFDECSLLITSANTDKQITYSNSLFNELIGVDERDDFNLHDFIKDDNSRAILDKQHDSRLEGRTSNYRLLFTPITGGGDPFPVEIVAVPIFDAYRKVIGSVGIGRDLRVEEASDEIYRVIERLSGSNHSELREQEFKEVFDISKKVIPFELAVLTIFSKDRTSAALYLNYDPKDQTKSERRWYELSEDMRKFVESDDADRIRDFEEFINQDIWKVFLDDSFVQHLLKNNLHSLMRHKVHGDNLSTITLFKKGKDAFSDRDWKNFKRLPMDAIANAALQNRKQSELALREQLITKMLACDQLNDIAKLLTTQLSKFYSWDHVAVFHVDYAKERFVLAAQSAKESNIGSNALLPQDYVQSYTEGLLGYVLHEKKELYISNVNIKAKLPARYIEGWPNIHSEMLIPLSWDGHIRWVLVISDQLSDAFNKEEYEGLLRIVNEVEFSIKKLVSRYQLAWAVDHTSDAIFFTDSTELNIKDTNPAAARLLGYKEPSDLHNKNLNINSLFCDESDFHRLKDANPIEVDLWDKSKSKNVVFPVLMSCLKLPADIPGRVIIAKDLTNVRRILELEAISKLFYELAVQTQTPLSLIFSWLRDVVKDNATPPSIADSISKALEQLHKVSITFDRLSLSHNSNGLINNEKLRLNLATELERTLLAFPETDRDSVERKCDENLPYVLADPFQISFVFQTIFSFLHRSRHYDDKVTASIHKQEKMVNVEISGVAPPTSSDSNLENSIVRTKSEMVLGESVIKEFIIKNHSGKYAKDISKNGEMKFKFSLPIHTSAG